MSILLPLGLVGGIGYLLIGRELQRTGLTQAGSAQRADLQAFHSLERDHPRRALRSVERYVETIGRRPGSSDAMLVNASGLVIAASSDDAIGKRTTEGPIRSALKSRHGYTGHDHDGKGRGEWQFVVPLTLNGKHYAYSLDFTPGALDLLGSRIRGVLVTMGVIALLVGTLLFYLLGGRALIRSHRIALKRAWLDGLTDLPNRRAFDDGLNHAVEAAGRAGFGLALAVFDINDFRFLNGSHGHAFGDKLLRRAAAALRADDAETYRIGGDEFAALCRGCGREAAWDLARGLSDKLAEAGVSATVGVSILGPDGSADLLYTQAAAALAEARRRGDAIGSYDDMRDDIRLITAEDRDALRQLIDEGRMTIAFQPIWNLDDGQLVGVEALSRPDPGCGMPGPAEAFDIAVALGRTRQLDQLCVAAALARAHELGDAALLFLNISPHTLEVPAVAVEWLPHMVRAAGLRPSQVVIEITEQFTGQTKPVVRSLHRLRVHGFKLALDDVGTGNVGLALLRDVAPDFVKIDRSIVSAAGGSPNARGVLLAMATFASETGAFVIAEGIEDAAVLGFLRQLDSYDLRAVHIINGGQGYGLGKPGSTVPTRAPELLSDCASAACDEVVQTTDRAVAPGARCTDFHLTGLTPFKEESISWVNPSGS